MNEFFNYIASNFGTFIFVFIRISTLFLSFPFLSENFVPLNIRILLILSLSFFILPYVPSQVNLESLSLISIFLLVLKEIFLGLFLSLLVRIFYGIVLYASELISYMMGLTVVNSFDPTFGMVSVLGRFFVFLFLLVFFETGGYRIFFGALFESFRVLPVGSIHIPDSLLTVFIREGSLLFYLAFKMAFPFLLSLFITNLALALINRLIPQINVFIVGLPLQLFVGLLFLYLGFGILIYFLRILTEKFVEEFLSILRLFGG